LRRSGKEKQTTYSFYSRKQALLPFYINILKIILHFTFLQQNGPISLGMMNDFRKTGQCDFALAQKSFDHYHAAWMIRKGDLYAEFYNRAYSYYFISPYQKCIPR